MQPRNSDNIQGLDVSQHQGDINWTSVFEAGKSFVFIKATEGATVKDMKFDFNYTEAKNTGLYVGAYHYAFPESMDDPILEADYFVDIVNNVGGFEGNLPPVLDLEINQGELGKDELSEWARIWMERVIEKIGIKPILYTYLDFGRRNLNESLGEYSLWFARYDVQQPEDFAGWNEWKFLQYTSSGHVPGITGKVDLNEFDGSLEELEQFRIDSMI
ncbi:glycoside hydrolase [Bacillus wiedmannii]|uniref:glycoside hydrolase family 25 protein n=1 Tax=Bacillus wiedmannii TaxID=1890302 RepID=UPI0010BCFC4B|nr:glycoside hydrolase family 25 protein [Bacillus wiedmannii]TKH17157.1 glycoside hydrolase [Bacillus wiedmannii]